MFICQNSEGVHPDLLKCCRGTCSFVGMLKGYMVRKRLGTPDPDELWKYTRGFLRKQPEQNTSTFQRCKCILISTIYQNRFDMFAYKISCIHLQVSAIS